MAGSAGQSYNTAASARCAAKMLRDRIADGSEAFSGRVQMANKPMTKKTFKTVKFVVYCYRESKKGKEEGTLSMTDARHKLVASLPERHFDTYDRVGSMIREFMDSLK